MSLLPQDDEARVKLAEEIDRVVVLLKEIDLLKEDIKAIAEGVEEDLPIKKAAFNKLAKAKHKEDAVANRKEAQEIEETLEVLFD